MNDNYFYNLKRNARTFVRTLAKQKVEVLFKDHIEQNNKYYIETIRLNDDNIQNTQKIHKIQQKNINSYCTEQNKIVYIIDPEMIETTWFKFIVDQVTAKLLEKYTEKKYINDDIIKLNYNDNYVIEKSLYQQEKIEFQNFRYNLIIARQLRGCKNNLIRFLKQTLNGDYIKYDINVYHTHDKNKRIHEQNTVNDIFAIKLALVAYLFFDSTQQFLQKIEATENIHPKWNEIIQQVEKIIPSLPNQHYFSILCLQLLQNITQNNKQTSLDEKYQGLFDEVNQNFIQNQNDNIENTQLNNDSKSQNNSDDINRNDNSEINRNDNHHINQNTNDDIENNRENSLENDIEEDEQNNTEQTTSDTKYQKNIQELLNDKRKIIHQKDKILIKDTQIKKSFKYKVYTNQFDVVGSVDKFITHTQLEQYYQHFKENIIRFGRINKKSTLNLQKYLAHKTLKKEKLYLEEGMIDTKMLNKIIINPTEKNIYKKIDIQEEVENTVVTLLLDNSGSMRGKPIFVTSVVTDMLASVLEKVNVKTEILGFTTKHWKGGETRKLWKKNGKKNNPGRLNDIAHIIFKAANQSWRSSKKNLALMMHSEMMKENIDGEAIIWACNRLLNMPYKRKIMIVISDGVPVDDSTLSENVSDYLDKHLAHAIDFVENKTNVELMAIGIGYELQYYEKRTRIDDVENLGEVLITIVKKLLGKKKKHS